MTDPTELERAEIPSPELRHLHAPPDLAGQDNRTKENWLLHQISTLLCRFCPRLETLELKGVTSCDLWAENADSRRSMADLGYHKFHQYPQHFARHIESESVGFWNKSVVHSSLATHTSPRYCGACAYAHPPYIHGYVPDHPVAKQVLLKTIVVRCGAVMVAFEGFGFDYCDIEELRGLREKGSLVQLQSVLCSLRRSFLHVSPECGVCPVTLYI